MSKCWLRFLNLSLQMCASLQMLAKTACSVQYNYSQINWLCTTNIIRRIFSKAQNKRVAFGTNWTQNPNKYTTTWTIFLHCRLQKPCKNYSPTTSITPSQRWYGTSHLVISGAVLLLSCLYTEQDFWWKIFAFTYRAFHAQDHVNSI